MLPDRLDSSQLCQGSSSSDGKKAVIQHRSPVLTGPQFLSLPTGSGRLVLLPQLLNSYMRMCLSRAGHRGLSASFLAVWCAEQRKPLVGEVLTDVCCRYGHSHIKDHIASRPTGKWQSLFPKGEAQRDGKYFPWSIF